MSYLALDIGKGLIKSAIVSGGSVSHYDSEVAQYVEGGKTMLAQATRLGKRVLQESGEDPTALGVAVPAIMNPDTKEVLSSGFLPELKGLDVGDLFSREFGLSVGADNNMRAAALGEALYGVGRSIDSLTYITLSTGCGFATVTEGKIQRGQHDFTGQVGFVEFGEGPIVERLSGSGISGAASRILGKPVTPFDVFLSAKKGVPPMVELIRTATDALATLLAWVQVSIDPDLIAVGGSIALREPEFVSQAARLMKEKMGTANSAILPNPKVVISELRENAGLIGAGELAARAVS